MINLPDYSNKFSSLDQCYPNSTSFNDTNPIYVSDYLSEDKVHWLSWLWIVILLNLIQLVLRRLDSKGKLTFITDNFGPAVKVQDTIRGPILPSD